MITHPKYTTSQQTPFKIELKEVLTEISKTSSAFLKETDLIICTPIVY